MSSSSKKFKVMEMVGKGSFASVYKVMRKSDGKLYALKRIKISKMSKKEIADTLNEVRFLASIQHKNIVGFCEAFLENNDSELCIIMEYCGCGDLSQKIERYKKRHQYINEMLIWAYLVQSLRALQVLHSRGIIHRDLKAANTFLAEDGSIKIGDMNVSKQLKHGPLNTQIGTPYYMSPEIWNNRPYDEKCDIWSIGCMIYELAALRPPFLGDSFPALKRAVVAGRYPSLPRSYSSDLTRIIERMLRVSPSERPKAHEILAMSEIASRMNELQSVSLIDNEAQDQHYGDLMSTIKVPHLLSKLNDVLPKPMYPSERVNNKPPLPPITSRSIPETGSNQNAPVSNRQTAATDENIDPNNQRRFHAPQPPTKDKDSVTPSAPKEPRAVHHYPRPPLSSIAEGHIQNNGVPQPPPASHGGRAPHRLQYQHRMR